MVVFLRYNRDTGKRFAEEIVRVAGIDEDGRYRFRAIALGIALCKGGAEE